MATEDELTSLSHLWTEPGWALAQVSTGALVILNRETKMTCLIEDKRVFNAVVQRMRANGVNVEPISSFRD